VRGGLRGEKRRGQEAEAEADKCESETNQCTAFKTGASH
jgi:hypothetical protein